MTHGWPGSVIELLETIGPLTDPTAHGGNADDAFHLVLPSLPGYGFSGEPAELGWDSGRIARAWAELMERLGYDRYVAQGGDVGALVTDAMGRQAAGGAARHPPELAPGGDGHRRSTARGIRAGTRGGCRGRHVPGERFRLLPGAVHAAADDRLRPAGFTRRPGGLDARPRHGQLRQDLGCLRRRAARRRSDAGEHRRQHHALLADRHRRLGRPLVLGERTRLRPQPVRPARLLQRSRFRSASPRSPARSSLPRAAGSRRSTPASPTSTRSSGAATSRPGRSRSSSRKRSVRHFARCGDPTELCGPRHDRPGSSTRALSLITT